MIVFIWVIAILMFIPDLVVIEVHQLFPELIVLLPSSQANWVYRSLVGILVKRYRKAQDKKIIRSPHFMQEHSK